MTSHRFLSWKLLVNTFNNNTDDRTIKLMHDSMLERGTDNLRSRIRIQSSLNMLEKCSDVNKMNFSKIEYKELHGVRKIIVQMQNGE